METILSAIARVTLQQRPEPEGPLYAPSYTDMSHMSWISVRDRLPLGARDQPQIEPGIVVQSDA